MPKRIGFLYEQVVSKENCIKAIQEMAAAKPKIIRAQRMKENAEKLGERLSQQLSTDTWIPKPYHTKTIGDGLSKKKRNLKIPCLWDQCVHHAIVQITAPYIERSNYFYNCSSIPGAGQIRAVRAIRRWMSKNHLLKYGMKLDIHHFYESCTTETVMKALSHKFKDKRFLALHKKILHSMGDTLAIGFNVSHWYANLVLSYIDNLIKSNKLPKCKYVRYMDDMLILHDNKYELHYLYKIIRQALQKMQLNLKSNWQIFKLSKQGISFLSYRFFKGYTLVTKKLMYKINHVLKIISHQRHITFHNACSALSYIGLLKHCNSFNFKKSCVYPYINISKCKKIVRNSMREQLLLV